MRRPDLPGQSELLRIWLVDMEDQAMADRYYQECHSDRKAGRGKAQYGTKYISRVAHA